jgi:hypothetical protein
MRRVSLRDKTKIDKKSPNKKVESAPFLDAERLGDADAHRHQEPDGGRKARDLLDGRSAVAGEERVEVLL